MVLTTTNTKAAAADQQQKRDPKDLWILHGQAYDFTDFVKHHPAGEKAILLGKGRDCTVLFESYHTNLPSSKILDKYRVEVSAVSRILSLTHTH